MSEIGNLIKQLASQDLKQPEIVYIREVDIIEYTCLVERVHTYNFDIDKRDTNFEIKVRLIVDDTDEQKNIPDLNTYGVIIRTDDNTPYLWMASKYTDRNYVTEGNSINQANELTNYGKSKLTLQSDDKMTIDSKTLEITVSDSISINAKSTINISDQIQISNDNGSLLDILNGITDDINKLNAALNFSATKPDPTVTSDITQLKQKISGLLK